MFAIGKYAEPDKKLAIFKDLDEKSVYIMQLLKSKEDLEEQMAVFGSINSVYVQIFLFNLISFRKLLLM